MRALADAHRVDACIHAAAVSNEAYARPAPLLAVAGNVGATANLLESARTKSWRRFLLVSTGSVFQLRADTRSPILEDEATAPANVYSTTKVCAEQLTRMYRTEYGLSASTVRISWVYGPPVISGSADAGADPVVPAACAARRSNPRKAVPTSRRASPSSATWRRVCWRRRTRQSCALPTTTRAGRQPHGRGR